MFYSPLTPQENKLDHLSFKSLMCRMASNIGTYPAKAQLKGPRPYLQILDWLGMLAKDKHPSLFSLESQLWRKKSFTAEATENMALIEKDRDNWNK